MSMDIKAEIAELTNILNMAKQGFINIKMLR